MKPLFMLSEKYGLCKNRIEDSGEWLICSQHGRSAKNGRRSGERKRKRMRFALTRFPCAAIFSWNHQKEKKFYITIQHTLWYESVRPESELNESDIEFVLSKAGKGLVLFQICNMLRSKHLRMILGAKFSTDGAYLRRLRFWEIRFLFCRAWIWLNSGKTCNCASTESFHASLLVQRRLEKEVLERHECTEIFIDSTYKTNSL